MDTTTLSLTQLTDEELLTRVTQLAADERETTTLLIAHLAELDARRLHLAEGYSSLFTYCTQSLHFSEHAAYNRIEAARASRRFPILLKLLSEGSLTLTAVRLLAPHLTAENHQELLDRARYQSKRVVEELIAQICPQPAVPLVLRRLPTRRSESTPGLIDGNAEGTPRSDELAAVNSPAPIDPPPRQPATVTPLAPQRFKVQFTVSAETVEKLRRAQDLLRHQIPDGDPAEIFDRALTALLEDLIRKKLAATDHPRGGRATTARSRHIPSEVKRAVWIRDGGRCAFVAAKGRRCNEGGFLEFHHVTPYAAGGEATADNIQLRCRAHNGYEGELCFGPRIPGRVREERSSYLVYRVEAAAGNCNGNSVRTEFACQAARARPR